MVLMGIRLPWIEQTFGLDRLMRYHKAMGPVVLALLMLHGFLRFAKISMLSPDGWQWAFWISLQSGGVHEWGLNLGKLGLSGFLLAAIFAKISRFSVPFHIWKPSHLLVYLAVPTVFVHSRMIGDDIVRFPYNVIWFALAAVFVAGVFYRLGYVGRRDKGMVHSVKKLKPETHDIQTMVLAPSQDPGAFASRKAGQFATLRFRRSSRWCEPRPFTISCSPDSSGLCFTIKKIGNYTSTLHSLEEGSQVICEGPYGIFTPDFETEKNLVFIAGGVGITPFFSCIRHVRQSGIDCAITLIWSNKTRGDIIAFDEIKRLSEEMEGRLKVVLVLTREEDQDFSAEQDIEKTKKQVQDPVVFEYGRVNETLLKKNIQPAGASFYLCGPKPMQRAVLGMLQNAFGIQPGHVRRERFFW